MLKFVATFIIRGINLLFGALKFNLSGKKISINEDLNKLSNVNDYEETTLGLSNDKHEEILYKLLHFMEVEKIYRNPDLTIKDVATMVGTNRSYISSTINSYNKTNFPTFLNKYRCRDFQEQFKESPEETCSNLSKRAGFGSVDSMKRTILSVTGMQFKDWRAQTLSEIEKQNKSASP